MTGKDAYNNRFDGYAKKRLSDNSDKPYLRGFYFFLLSDGKRSFDGAYGYLSNVISFVNYYNITDPTEIDFDKYTEYLAYAYNGKSSSYQIMLYSSLKTFSRYLRAKNICQDDYMSYIKRPKFQETDEAKEKRENGFMNTREVKQFLSNIKSQKNLCWRSRDYAMALILLNSGIRSAALQKLDVDDIDFENQTMSVLEKGNKSRIISLDQTTLDAVMEWINYRSQIVDNEEMALFISNHKQRMTAKTIYNTIKKYGEVVKGKHITPHKTRATYGTRLYDKTHDVYFVQQCMGHASPQTSELYIRGQKGNMSRKASEIMSDILK